MMKRTTALAAAAIAVSALACGDSLEVKNTSPKGSVGGLIVDAVTRMPIEGATVTTIAGSSYRDGTTDVDGRFSITDVQAGEVIITIDGPEGSGYQSVWINEYLDDSAGEFPANNTITLGPIGLIAGTNDFTVRVLDLEGRPVSMYSLTMRHFVQYIDFGGGSSVNRGEVILGATTGTDGRATFTGLPPFYQLSADINATGLLNLPPLAPASGPLSYPGGSQTVNLRAFGDPTPDVILDPGLAASLSIRASNIADLYDPPGSSGTATVLAINDVAHVAFNLPIKNNPTVVISDEQGTPIANQPAVTVSDDNIVMTFGNNPLVPGNEYNVFIHAVAAAGGNVSGDFVGSFFTAGLNDDVTVANVVRNGATQVVSIEFSEPIGIGANSGINLSGGNCVLFFDFDLNASGTVGDFTNERGSNSCSIALVAVEPDPPGLVPISGYTKFWQFTAPPQSDGTTPLPAGTRFDIRFNRVVSSSVLVETTDGLPVRDFVAPNDIPINP